MIKSSLFLSFLIFFSLSAYLTGCELWEPDIDLDKSNDLIVINYSSCTLNSYVLPEGEPEWQEIGEIPPAEDYENPVDITFKGALPKGPQMIYIVHLYDLNMEYIADTQVTISGREDITFTISSDMCL